MKTRGLWMALMALMMCFVCNEAYAYDIAVENADGVTIYYNYINEGKELEVTYQSINYKSYSGSVVIPEEVTFMNRTRKVTSIGERAFYDCSALTVTIPNSVTSIGERAFSYCRSLTSVTIPGSVTSIGKYAFYECSSLTSVTIPNSVTSIGSNAFYNCSGLTSVTIPNSVTSIGDDAFFPCSGLTSLTIGNGVTSIGDWAFYGCSGLTSVIIPGSVTSIEVSAFYGCDNLEEVVSFIKEPFVIDGMASTNPCFSTSTFDNATLYVPVGTIDKYNETAGWWDFSNIVEGVPNAIKEVKAEDGLITEDDQHEYYQLDGQRMAKLQRGINIVRDKNGATKKVLMR